MIALLEDRSLLFFSWLASHGLYHEKEIRENIILVITCVFSSTHDIIWLMVLIMPTFYQDLGISIVLSDFIHVTFSNPETLSYHLNIRSTLYNVVYVALGWLAFLNKQLNVIRPLTEALQLGIQC